MTMQNEYRTSDFYLACFLACRGMRLLSFDKSDRRRINFVFNNSSARKKLVDDFMLELDTTVDAKEFVRQIKRMKAGIYDA